MWKTITMLIESFVIILFLCLWLNCRGELKESQTRINRIPTVEAVFELDQSETAPVMVFKIEERSLLDIVDASIAAAQPDSQKRAYKIIGTLTLSKASGQYKRITVFSTWRHCILDGHSATVNLQGLEKAIAKSVRSAKWFTLDIEKDDDQ